MRYLCSKCYTFELLSIAILTTVDEVAPACLLNLFGFLFFSLHSTFHLLKDEHQQIFFWSFEPDTLVAASS